MQRATFIIRHRGNFNKPLVDNCKLFTILLNEKDTALDFSLYSVLYGAIFLYNINLYNE